MTIKEYFTTLYKIISTKSLYKFKGYFQTSSPYLEGTKRQYEAIRKQLALSITFELMDLVPLFEVIYDRFI